MPSIRLDHIAIALPCIADAPSVLVAVLGGVQTLGIVVQLAEVGAPPEAGPPAGLTFRWPGSPMRILVDVDPTAAGGPF